MKALSKKWMLIISLVWVLPITGCAYYSGVGEGASGSNGANISDAQLQQRVVAAINNASDVPKQLLVETNNSVVRLVGSLQCEDCGGNRTPGTSGTIQQNLGALVRAVPGVTQVEFVFENAP